MRRVLWLPLAVLTTAASPVEPPTPPGPTNSRKQPTPNAQPVEAGTGVRARGVHLRAPTGASASTLRDGPTAAEPSPRQPGTPAPPLAASNGSVLVETLLALERDQAEARGRAAKSGPVVPLTTLGPTVLRERPTPNAKVLQTVEAGTVLETNGERAGWVRIRTAAGTSAFARRYQLTAAKPAPPRPGEPAPPPASSDASVLLEQLEAELALERDPAVLEARARTAKRGP